MYSDACPLEEKQRVAAVLEVLLQELMDLLDSQDCGATWLDVKNIFLDMRQGLAFEQAFLNRLGMSLDYYENNFFTLILDYLPQPRTTYTLYIKVGTGKFLCFPYAPTSFFIF
jgi:hypothetical protein